jgi:hypothetical protein
MEHIQQYNFLGAVHPDLLFDSQGIRIIQSNTLLLLLKYTYIQALYISVF